MPNNNQPPQITSVEQIRAKSTAVETLPSGIRVRLRRMHVLDMAGTGLLPQELTNELMNTFIAAGSGGVQPRSEEDKQAFGMDMIRNMGVEKFMTLLNEVAVAVMAEPQLVREPGPGEIGPMDLSFDDRVHLFTWAAGQRRRNPRSEEAAASMSNFLAESQTEGVVSVEGGEGVRRAPEQPTATD